MQTEQNLIRSFCYKCDKDFGKAMAYCMICGNEDLIPNPHQEISIKEAEKIYPRKPVTLPETEPTVEELYNELKEPQSKLQLDEDAVRHLLNDDFGFLTGNAGTGKSTIINEISRLHPELLEVCASTGIAAVNLNSKTLHSTLKYFDTRSLENNWREGKLHFYLRLIRARKQKLLIDEVSMIPKEQLDFLINAIDDINSDNTGKKLGCWLAGDICQLPPVKAEPVFKSDYWNRFENNMVRLTKVWRQDSLDFMTAINLIRQSKANEAVKLLQDCGVTFQSKIDDNFLGTTIIPKNDEVDFYNEKRLRQVSSPLIRVTAINRGEQNKEWQRMIPYELRLKVGAYVMILCNQIPDFEYVNGDCGVVEQYNEKTEMFYIKLKRTGDIVSIPRIHRYNMQDNEPVNVRGNFTPYIDFKSQQWVVGAISYFPLRLAYASTTHKTQGLSLDLVQIDSRHNFFGAPSMAYVAISRARTPEGLFIVGSPESVARKIIMSKDVRKYI